MGIKRLQLLKGEVESAFCTENGAHSFADIRAIDPRINLDQQMHEIGENQQRITQFAGHVLGRKAASTLQFGASLRGDGTALSTGASAANDTLQDLLELCMGGSESDAGSTEDSSASTTTSIVVQNGHGSRFHSGGAIMVEGTGPNGENEISIIESISTDTLTLKVALSNAPTNGDNVWNSYTTYVDPSSTSTWQFQAIGDDSAEVFLALGCVGGFSLANLLQTDGLPTVNFDMMVTEWQSDSASLTAGSYDGADFLGTTEGMEVHYQDHGNTTRNLISVSALDIQPNITRTQLFARGNADKQHTDRIRMTGCAPTATFTADPSSAFYTAHANQTEKILLVTFGRTAGSSWAIEIPRAVISAVPQPAGHAEQNAVSVALRAREDNCGGSATARERSPIRVHRL